MRIFALMEEAGGMLACGLGFEGVSWLGIRAGFVSRRIGFGIYAGNRVLGGVVWCCFVNAAFCLMSRFSIAIYVKGSYLLRGFAPIFYSFFHPVLLNDPFFFRSTLFPEEGYNYQLPDFSTRSTFPIFMIYSYSYEMITFFVLIYEKNIHQGFKSWMAGISLIEQTFHLINF